MSARPRPAEDYAPLLAEIKSRLRLAQTRAVLAVNAELIRLYWEIGAMLDQRQKREGWGAGVIPRLARDLRNDLPELKGFSERNIKRMLAFYREYPQLASVSQTETQSRTEVIVPLAVALFPNEVLLGLPWGHHAILMTKVKNHSPRLWYMRSAVEHGWSRNTLELQIASKAHQRQGKAVNNFTQRLPVPESELVQQALKDPYIFDFLTLADDFRERELETGLIDHVEKFLLELGQGFAFVRRQHHVELDGRGFIIDLLFYHLKLRCYIVIDLKRGSFKPEYAGKMNFYCNIVDDHLRQPGDAPTIGLILCQESDRVLAEYALRGIEKPIGVSSYELTRELPNDLKSSLPSIEEIEQALAHDPTDDR